jgi:hypothetical protein
VTARVGNAWDLLSLPDEHLGLDDERPATRGEHVSAIPHTAFHVMKPLRALRSAQRSAMGIDIQMLVDER